jgi:hypothetical protein
MNNNLLVEVSVLSKFLRNKHPELREGQSLMNALGEINFSLYKEITGTENDPFYQDERIPAFFEKILQS